MNENVNKTQSVWTQHNGRCHHWRMIECSNDILLYLKKNSQLFNP